MKAPLMFLILAALVLAGCTQPVVEPVESTPPVAQATEPADPTPDTTAEPTPEPQPEPQPEPEPTPEPEPEPEPQPTPEPGLSGTFYFRHHPQAPAGYVGDFDTAVGVDEDDLVGRYGPGEDEENRFMYLGNSGPVHVAGTATFEISSQNALDYDESKPLYAVLRATVYLDGVAYSGSAADLGGATITIDLPEGDYSEIDASLCVCSNGGNSGNYRVFLDERTNMVLSG